MKSSIIIFGLLCLFFITICLQCDNLAMDKKYPIYLVNKAPHPIGFYFATGGQYGTFYPDSLPITNQYVTYQLDSGKRFIYDSGLNWEKAFNEGFFPKDTLSVFIFHSDTLKKYPWDLVRACYKILKRYDLSLYDLKKLDWTITYP